MIKVIRVIYGNESQAEEIPLNSFEEKYYRESENHYKEIILSYKMELQTPFLK